MQCKLPKIRKEEEEEYAKEKKNKLFRANEDMLDSNCWLMLYPVAPFFGNICVPFCPKHPYYSWREPVPVSSVDWYKAIIGDRDAC